MTAADFLLIAVLLFVLGSVAWVAWNVGQSTARREYQAALASARAEARAQRARAHRLEDEVTNLRRARLRAVPPPDVTP